MQDLQREKGATGSLLFTVGVACEGESLLLGTRSSKFTKLCTRKSPFQATNSLIHYLIIGAIQTSSTTSIVALVMLISTYTIKHSSTVSTALFYAIGPVYVLTLIYNLNLRPYDDVGASETGTGGTLMRPSLMRPPLTHPSFTNLSCTVDICMDSIYLQKLCRDEVRREQQY
ncbi:hypothetical protein K438DRAFT_1749484 [Mycena galopus ATCC 62051]|nr:hypothetical protein K438DRAFT_1749484 [Mycena galopus ATCC 62051]